MKRKVATFIALTIFSFPLVLSLASCNYATQYEQEDDSTIIYVGK